MQVDVVTDDQGFRSLQDIWNPLLSRSGTNNIFLTYEWLSTWWRHFGHRHRLFIVVVRSGGRIVGLLPLMATLREGFRQLGVISNRISVYKDFIIDAEQDRTEVIEAILRALVDSGGWDFLLLNGFPEDSGNFDAFRTASGRFHGQKLAWRESEVALSVGLKGSYDSYLGSLRKSFRRNLSDGQKRLSKEAARVSYESDVTEDRLDYLIDKVIDLNAARWKEIKGQYSAFEDPSIRAFYKDLARCLLPKGGLDFSIMHIDDEIASMSLCFRHEETLFGLINSYDSRFSRFSLGNLQILHLIKKGFEEGVGELDLLSGAEAYKYQFNPTERRLYNVGFFGPGPKASLAHAWFFGVRPHLERMKASPMRKWYWWYRMRNVRRG